ncbi:MAG: beta-propeller fold lactonase family protein [Myxococcota bacterium]
MRFEALFGLCILVAACGDDATQAETETGTTSAASRSTGDPATTTTGSSTVASSSTSAATSTSADPTTTDPTTETSEGDSSTGAPPVPGAPRLYVSGGNAVSVWSIEDSGALNELQRLDQATSIGPLAARDTRTIYAARVQEQSVVALDLDPVTGMLTQGAITPVAHRPVYLAVDTTGQWLLSTDFGGDLVRIYPLQEDGSVGETPSEDRAVQSRPHAILQDPGGGYVFVPHRDSNLVEQYIFDADAGTLTPNDPPSVAAPDGAGPRHMVFAPDSSYAYVVNEFSSSVTAYAYDAGTGLLTQGDTVSALPPDFAGENTGADIHITLDGGFVYASMRGLDALSAFSAGADGSLSFLQSVPTEARPREFGFGPFGRFIYAAGQDTGMLASYTLQADGSLAAGPTYDVGADPLWVLGVELSSPDR